MAGFCQDLCLFVLIMRGTCSPMAPDYFSHWTSFDNRDSPVPSDATQDDSMIAQEYSWQRLQVNENGLPKCVQEQNRCRQIGIIGAGEDYFFKGSRVSVNLHIFQCVFFGFNLSLFTLRRCWSVLCYSARRSWPYSDNFRGK